MNRSIVGGMDAKNTVGAQLACALEHVTKKGAASLRPSNKPARINDVMLVAASVQ